MVQAGGHGYTGAPMTPTAALPVEAERNRTLVRRWLYFVAGLLVLMILVGGATRLTDSGLSITEWKPIHGVVPPLSDADWEEEFAKYKQIPEYRQINAGMTLNEFKTIFWWEWSHRMLGRLIGLVVVLPLAYFWFTRRIERKLAPRIVAMVLLGGLQGAVGWWMVASGLSERTDVSQYRLATHLTLAFAILAYVGWVAQSIAPPRHFAPAPAGLKWLAGVLLALVFMQIYLGGLVAGLDAGLTYNTWPLMDGRFVPAGMFTVEPLWRDFFENITTVQFDHRVVAYAVAGMALVVAWAAWRWMPGTRAARRAAVLAGLVLLQGAIGIATLVAQVPLALGLLHQLGAAAVLGHAIVLLRGMWPPLPMTAPSLPEGRSSRPAQASG
jgi:cytochrome c oxidase assembly protein subunit 15